MRLTDGDWQYVDERAQDFTGRAWVFERIRSFLASDARMLVIVAPPGTGKTAIAARLAQASSGRLAEGIALPVPVDALDAAVFCRAGRVSLLEVAQDLADQLSVTLPGFAEMHRATLAPQLNVSDIHVQAGDVAPGARVAAVPVDLHRLGPELAFDDGLALPLRRLAEKPGFQPPVVLVDSLDEAFASSAARSLPARLAALVGVRLILTTRDDPRVLAELRLPGAGSARTELIRLVDDAPPGVDDVTDYVLARLRPRLSNDVAEILADRIATAAAGNFLYARVVVGRFDEEGDLARLDAQAARDLALPVDGLRGIYREFLAREIAGDDERWTSLMRPILAPLAVALGDGFDTAQLAAIGSVLARRTLSRTDARDVTRLAGQLLDGSPPDGPFRVYHQSFAEFLLDANENPDRPVDPDEAHAAVVAGLLPRATPAGDVAASWAAVDWGVVDRYGLLYLAAHLRSVDPAGLARLLTSYPYLEAKVVGAGFGLLIQDFDIAGPALRGSDWRRIIKLVRGALRLARQAIVRDPAELPTQLVGRLGGLPEEPIRSLVEGARRSRGMSWLEPLTPSLAPPGGAARATLRGHEGTPRSVAISADGRIGASAGNSSFDWTVRVWDLDGGDEILQLRDQAAPGGYTPLALSSDGRLLLTAYEREVRLWDLANGASMTALAGHAAVVQAVAISSRSIAASGDADGAIGIWDLGARELVRSFRDGPGGIRSIALDRDGGRVALMTDDAVELWEVETGRLMARHPMGSGRGSGWSLPIAMSTDASQVAFLDSLWTVASDDLRQVLPDDGGRALAITVDGHRILAAGSTELGCDLWDLDGHRLRSLPDRDARPVSGAITGDGRWALTAYYDHRVLAWDFDVPPDDGSASTDDAIQRVAIDADGRFAVAFTESGVSVWDLETGQAVTGSPEGDAALETIQGRLDATADTIARLEEKRAAAETQSGVARSTTIEAAFVTPFDPFGDRHVWVADPGGPFALHWLEPMGKTSESEEPTDIVAGGNPFRADVIAVDGRESVARLDGHSMPIWAGAISADGRRAATGSIGRLVRVWDLPEGSLRATLPPHRDPVSVVGLSSDGSLVMSASWDGSVRLWDVDAGRMLATFSGDSRISTCAISPDGSIVVAGDLAGRVHLLRLRRAGG